MVNKNMVAPCILFKKKLHLSGLAVIKADSFLSLVAQTFEFVVGFCHLHNSMLRLEFSCNLL